MDSREDILRRVRERIGRTAADDETARSEMATYLAKRVQGPRPVIATDLLASFREKSLALSSTVDSVVRMEEVPAAVARYLVQNGLPLQAVCWTQLAGLAWREAGVAVEARAAHGDDMVGITGAFCAIAETATLMLCSSTQTPAVTSLLPETHIAVLQAHRLVAGMEEAWQLARAELDELPRAVNFISGPSRTGDIEQTIVLGAHGPYRVHIILCA